jgi:hypothetical protein
VAAGQPLVGSSAGGVLAEGPGADEPVQTAQVRIRGVSPDSGSVLVMFCSFC